MTAAEVTVTAVAGDEIVEEAAAADSYSLEAATLAVSEAAAALRAYSCKDYRRGDSSDDIDVHWRTNNIRSLRWLHTQQGDIHHTITAQ